MADQKLHQLQMAVNYMKLGRWMRDKFPTTEPRLLDRKAIFDVVAESVADARVLYMEFGVHRGESMRYWSARLSHADAKLHGFDSFEGLPEAFDGEGGRYQKGAFDVGGQIPRFDDERVRFFKGWFDEVLPTYEPPAHDVLVLNLDADLYSSTIFVLRHLRDLIVPGTFVYLDDMSRPDHEPKALRDFMDESGLRFRLIATDQTLNNAAFICEG